MSTGLFLCLAAATVDGDTLSCANIEAANGRVRLARSDAVELRRPGGEEAKRVLEALLTNEVFCRTVDASPAIAGFQTNDRYGRIVAECSVEGRDLGEAMIAAGMAEAWPHE